MAKPILQGLAFSLHSGHYIPLLGERRGNHSFMHINAENGQKAKCKVQTFVQGVFEGR